MTTCSMEKKEGRERGNGNGRRRREVNRRWGAIKKQINRVPIGQCFIISKI